MARANTTNSVSLKPFRDRYVELEARGDANAVAIRLGWYTPVGAPDTPRVRRAVGLRLDAPPGNGRRGRVKYRERVTLRNAKALADALEMDYQDCGI